MAVLRTFLAQSPGTLMREFLVVAAIVVVATIATLLVGGPGTGLPFDTSLDQVPLPF